MDKPKIHLEPQIKPPLDEDFIPASLYNRDFRVGTAQSGVPLAIGLERSPGILSTFRTRVFPKDHPRASENLFYVERIVKFLLWQRGGFRLYIGGPRDIGAAIKQIYSPDGQRHFDENFLS